MEQGPIATGKDATSGQGSQRIIVPEQPRRESSTTALKAAVKTGGSATLIKEKEQRAEALKTKDRSRATEEAAPIPTISVRKRGRLQKAVV